jgi:FKBP-type peptidyl-prolyl cis-trans isomerase FkpA
MAVAIPLLCRKQNLSYVYYKLANVKGIISFLMFMPAFAGIKAQVNIPAVSHNIPDSIKITSFIATVQPLPGSGNKKWETGIGANEVAISLLKKKNRYQVDFTFPQRAKLITKGLSVKTQANHNLGWKFNEEGNEYYKLLITSATDSAEHFTLYSGYIYFPAPNKWKLIGTCKVEGEWTTLKTTSLFKATRQSSIQPVQLTNAWHQRSNGSWKSISPGDTISPVLAPFSNIDSLEQFAAEKAFMEKDIAAAKTEINGSKDGVYYTIMKAGSGKPVLVTDTVTVHYKGYRYADGVVFDQTKDKPARFPLKRLIKGWQTGLPFCNAGGKIKLVILSGQAYAIRTRAAKIPPNAVLVFEIEVVDATASNE